MFNDILLTTAYVILLIVFIYAIVVTVSYTALAISSIRETLKYNRNKHAGDGQVLADSKLTPGISIIIPAYNEAETIVDTVRSMLNLQYDQYEIIIVNDGSTDNTLNQLLNAYRMKKIPASPTHKLEVVGKVKGVYQSENDSWDNITVVDKENSGKADSLNAGLNTSRMELVTMVDADCVLEPHALERMVIPYLKQKDKKLIAVGGNLGISNTAHIRMGQTVEKRTPNKLLAIFQTLEYIRSFLLARMAWSKLNGLMVVSGAFGLFDKATVVGAGGYSRETVGEDMEILLRMRKYMHDRDEKYDVKYIPETLCWTEVPEKIGQLARQRDRWTRGNIQSILTHAKMAFKPKFGVLGWFSFPYWILVEWFGPIFEFLGLVAFTILAILGMVNWPVFFILLAFVYFSHLMVTMTAIYLESKAFGDYTRPKDTRRLIGAALIEPFTYHLLCLVFKLRGNISYLFGRKKWGTQNRKGFQNA